MATKYCDCCGLIVQPEAGEDCPRCLYPVNPAKEARFLDEAIRNLQRVADHGGANVRVLDLIRRYQERSHRLHQDSLATAPPVVSVSPALTASAVPPAEQLVEEESLTPVVLPAPALPRPAPVTTVLPNEQESPPLPVPQRTALSAAVRHTPVPQQPEHPAVPQEPTVPRRVFSFRSFFADQAINIIASLGAFLILAGALSFIATTPNLGLSFLIVCIIHVLFGVTGFTTSRLPAFRVVAVIYTIIFALLIPLVGFSAYRLVANNTLPLPTEVLIALASVYAAVVYGVLALFQRYTPFAYLSMMALLIADLAIARACGPGYWWWPDIAMLLAFAALICVQRPTGSTWPFSGAWAILRQPVHLLMSGILTATVASVLFISLYSFSLDSLGTPLREVRLAILGTIALLLLWGSLWLWLTKQTRGTRELAYLLLLPILALCYSLDFQPTGYALALTGMALFYHILNRLAGRLLQPLGQFSLDLDQLALALILLVPFLCAPLLPGQLFAAAYGIAPESLPSVVIDWPTGTKLLALGIGLLLTITIVLRHAGGRQTPAHAAWCWLLLLGGFLLTWGYALGVLALRVAPVWSFLVLALALIALAVFVRQRFAAAWANPLDVLALFEMILMFTLSGTLDQNILSALFLCFATLTYTVLFFQRRQAWFFLPLVFAVSGQFLLATRPLPMLLLSVFLPLTSAAICRLVPHRPGVSLAHPLQPGNREWPLLGAGLLAGVIFSIHEVLASMHAIAGWSPLALPVGLEIAFPALAWYTSATLARRKWWLVPAVIFAPGALLIPGNAFWVLAILTPVLAILSVGVRRLAGRDWALPLYLVAVLAAVMTGYSGLTQDHGAATAWILLGFAALAYLIGVIDNLPLAMWIAPCLATASLVISAGLLGDLYRPPALTLICVALGISRRFLHRLPQPFLTLARRVRAQSPQTLSHLLYALPFYTTALVAAILTGIYGTLFHINNLFYSAIPDTLLASALIAFVVLLVEQRPTWLWLVAGFAIWGIGLVIQLTAFYMAHFQRW
jgi:hypothetical protein